MALSNIFREPRREITESAVGIAIFGAAVTADYYFGCWLEGWAGYQSYSWGQRAFLPWPIGMMIGVLLLIVSVAVIFITHSIGDAVCNALDRRGIRLRPRTRC